VSIDPERNGAKQIAIQRISASDSAAEVLVVPAKEDWMIAVHVARMARSDE
jgi:acetate kinase